MSSFPATNITAALPWWIAVITVVGAMLLFAGGVIALVNPGMLAPGEQINGAVQVYSGYLVSRNLAIAGMLLAAFAMRARATLVVMLVLTATVQFLDAAIDCLEAR